MVQKGALMPFRLQSAYHVSDGDGRSEARRGSYLSGIGTNVKLSNHVSRCTYYVTKVKVQLAHNYCDKYFAILINILQY